MRARVRVRDRNRLPEAIRTVDGLNRRKIRVGVLGGGQAAMIAAVHEFGANIPVTPKMRGYLASQGLYLKKTTTHIRIPERSFIRAGWDQNERRIVTKYKELIGQAIESGIPAEALLNALGLEAKGKMQEFARDLKDPANSPFTVEQKGSSNPLVDSGNLIGSIEYEIE
ncbi:hypothetical protein [Exiguobacterium sp. s5]|uniref:hypothetical protein n=1 Tax=Exiguobacterium sp. s5 TaxID=2751239 RepID=UPI002036C318|nr:hypothetical protein [Exiguobacterium sp. s5]